MQLSAKLELLVEPQELLKVRNKVEEHKISRKVLIKWKDTPTFDATRESAYVVMEQFLNFHLEDKVKVLTGSIAMSQ